jgi:molybdopterin-guanine dinucleotide biosynthesis protein B
MKVLGVAGFKNSGKTTLIEKLVKHLTGLGYRISTVKHAHHSFDIDHEGRDSFRHRTAGATQVAVISRERTAIIHELRGTEPPTLQEVLLQLQPCDLVIVEGYKRDLHDKIEVRNVAFDHPLLAGNDPTVVAVAANGNTAQAGVPTFDRDDVQALVGFVIAHCKLSQPSPMLRRAVADDADRIRMLTRAVYSKWIGLIGREPMPMQADFEKAVKQHWIDILEQDGALLGLVEMIPQADHLFVENLAVAEFCQGQGLGTQLLAHAELLARRCNLTSVQLATNQAFASNVAFYEKRGYEIIETKAFAAGGFGVRFRKSVS